MRKRPQNTILDFECHRVHARAGNVIEQVEDFDFTESQFRFGPAIQNLKLAVQEMQRGRALLWGGIARLHKVPSGIKKRRPAQRSHQREAPAVQFSIEEMKQLVLDDLAPGCWLPSGNGVRED